MFCVINAKLFAREIVIPSQSTKGNEMCEIITFQMSKACTSGGSTGCVLVCLARNVQLFLFKTFRARHYYSNKIYMGLYFLIRMTKNGTY